MSQTIEERRAAQREASRRWRAAHPGYQPPPESRARKNEQRRQRRQADLAATRKALREDARRWREAHPGQAAESNRRHHARLRAAVLDHYGWACACCGATDRLSVDHVNGDGRQHRAELGIGSSATRLYRWLVSNGFPEGFQTLCRPCNASKADGPRRRITHSAVLLGS